MLGGEGGGNAMHYASLAILIFFIASWQQFNNYTFNKRGHHTYVLITARLRNSMSLLSEIAMLYKRNIKHQL
jgi:hypothetical protein